MARPRHVYLLDPDEDSDENLRSSQPGSIASASTSSRAIRRVPSYRPLPIPGASTTSQNPFTTSTTTIAATTTSTSARPLPSVLALSIPTRPGIQPALPSSPTRPTGLRESSTPPSSPSSPTMAAASRQRYNPRSSTRMSTESNPSDAEGTISKSPSSPTRLGFSTTTTMARSSISTRVGRPKAGPRTPTSPTFATSLASLPASANVHSSSSSSVAVSSDRSITTPSLTSASTPTSSTPPPSSFPLSMPSSSSSTSFPTPAHKLARKSRSKLNLKSQSSQSTLRPKRSKASLAPPPPPSPEVLVKRGHNMNPLKVFVNRLPPELLSVVFLLLISSSSLSSWSSGLTMGLGVGMETNGTNTTAVTVDTKAPRTISQVCHFWRCVALDEPLLWARTLNLREGPKWIIETLKRSGECTIDVVGLRDGLSSTTVTKFSGDWSVRDRMNDDCGGSGRGAVGRTSVLGVVLNELKRIRKLHLTIERKEEWKWFLDILMREEAPVLESLTVKSLVRRVTSFSTPGSGGYDGDGCVGSRGGSFGSSLGGGGFGMGFDFDMLGLGTGDDSMKLTVGMFKGKAPKLKSLSLSMVSLCMLSPLPYLSSLTTLQITDLEDTYQMNVWSWLSIIRQTPLLHTLILRSVFSPEIPTESEIESASPHTGNVVLKKLRFVELKGTLMECCEFVEKLVVPGECKLMMGCNRANNAHAAVVLGDWLRERKRRSEHMEGILKTPWEVMKESSERRRSLLVHPSVAGLVIKVNEGGREVGVAEEDEGECVVNLDLAFGFVDPQSEERHRIVIEIFDILTRALHMVYEDKGGFDALNLSLFGVRDGIKFWGDGLVQFLTWLDRVEHLQEMSGYTASVVFPLLVHSPGQQHQRRGSAASTTSVGSTSTGPVERFRQSVLLPSLSKVTLAFVEFGENVDDEFEASCDVRAVPDFVRRRYGLVGGISAIRQRVGSVKVRFECCSGPKSILDELRRLGVEYRLGWACDFDDD